MKAELFALQIGNKRCPESSLFGGGGSASVEYSCFAYLVRSSRRLILVDPGFGDAVSARRDGYEDFVSVVELLSRLGLAPEQITDVVITHAHRERVGAADKFPQARLYVSVREAEAAQEAAAGPDNPEKYRAEDWHRLTASRHLHWVKNCLAVDEHLRLDVVGGHTRGFMLPTFMIDGVSLVMLAGDNAPMYRHLRGEAFPPHWCEYGGDVRERLKMRMYTAFVLPGCDPRIMRRYPLAAPGIARIVSADRLCLS